MDDTSSPDADASFLTSSVSSILGVKGPLRFRPHGSNQKAHVILRRVTLSDDSNDNSEYSTVVRFSLFAQKRIEVKPGKEILLTVASEDGKFGDLPVVLEGDQNTPQTSEENNFSHPANEEKHAPINSHVSQSMPPRMRRAWTKKLEVSPSIEELYLPSTARTSAGVQTEPFYVHSSVQTLDADNPTVTQAKLTHGSGNLAATASISPGASAAIHSPNPRRYVSLKVQTDSEMWMTEAAGLAVKPVSVPMTDELTAVNQTSEVGRSLSPMELDSMPGSRHASSSPTVSPKEIDTTITTNTTPRKRKSLPASPTSSIASSSGAQDMQLSPVNSRSSSAISRATESVSALSTAVASQATNHDITSFVGSHHIRAQRSTTSETSSHHPRPETDPQKLVMDSLQRNQQRQYTTLTSLPAIPGSKSISPTASSILSTSLSKDQDAEYSPRDPLFNPSSIPPEDWQLYPNIAQLFGVPSQIYSNAVASSSK
ncbi:hypothetical protein F5887DRAFT_19417 [Amanita rubescens]|nr:hypothetical protein F5887DRAFT_19417 [Amanita rubescens]